LGTVFGETYSCAGGGTMISGGGKYWPEAGNGAPRTTSISPAESRAALVFMDAFPISDALAADLLTREPAGGNPS
jgi:hypothetical protein